MLFFGSFRIGMPSFVCITILLAKISQMEERDKYVGNTLHKLLEDNGRLGSSTAKPSCFWA